MSRRCGSTVQRWRSTRGQATVEFALVMPVVVLVALAIVQVALVGRHRLLIIHAAREGARAAAVGESNTRVRADVAEASGLDPARLRVEVRRQAKTVTVTVRYRSPTDLPMVGALIDEVELSATAHMRQERPP